MKKILLQVFIIFITQNIIYAQYVRFSYSSLMVSEKDGKYGYVDFDWNLKIPYKYEKADEFSRDFYAKVQKDNTEYLIDTLGKEYLYADDITALTKNVRAINLNNKSLLEIPGGIFSHAQVELLFLANNSLTELPVELGQLTNLELLNLRNNNLTQIPIEIAKLDKLIFLNLDNNEELGLKSLCEAFENYPKNIKITSDEEALNYNDRFLLITTLAQKNLPTGIGKIKNLVQLNFIKNNELNFESIIRTFKESPLKIILRKKKTIISIGLKQNLK